jgi:hypothetical protein
METAMSQDKIPLLSGVSPLLELTKMLGGVVRSSPTAIGIAKVILAGLYDPAYLASQEPFFAEEQGDLWVIRGSSPDPALAATVTLAKSDASMVRLDVPTRMK